MLRCFSERTVCAQFEIAEAPHKNHAISQHFAVFSPLMEKVMNAFAVSHDPQWSPCKLAQKSFFVKALDCSCTCENDYFKFEIRAFFE